jgi:circadian clock protein KaiB
VMAEKEDKLILYLYVSGMTAKSMNAIKNIRSICEENFMNCFELNIIDLYKDPELARDNQIIFSPSLVKTYPPPKKTLIGDFSDKNKVLRALNFIPKK